jgi:uncharacterized protein YqfA (UPF0365 family)
VFRLQRAQLGCARCDAFGKLLQSPAAQRRGALRPATTQAAEQAIEAAVLEIATLGVEARGEVPHPPALEQCSRH